MPVGFGQGESVTRLSRALDVRGRLPLELDTVAVPVFLVEDLGRVPWRRSGRGWFCGRTFLPGAGQFAAAAVQNVSANPAVLDGLIIFSTVATIVLVGMQAITTPIIEPVRTNELTVGQSDFGAPLNLRGDSNLGAVVAVPSPFLAVSVPANTSVLVPLELLLNEDASAARSLVVSWQTAGAATHGFSAFGRWWDDHEIE